MPKFAKNEDSFMKKYSTKAGKHAKPSSQKFFGRGLLSMMGLGGGSGAGSGSGSGHSQLTPPGFGGGIFGALSRRPTSTRPSRPRSTDFFGGLKGIFRR